MLQQALAISKQHRSERSETYARLLMNLGRVELAAATWSAPSNTSARAWRSTVSCAAATIRKSRPCWWSCRASSCGMTTCAAPSRPSREAVNIFSATVDPRHPDRVLAEMRLAEVLLAQNRVNEPARSSRSRSSRSAMLYGEDSQQVAAVLDSLALVRRSQGKLERGRGLCPPRSGGQ